MKLEPDHFLIGAPELGQGMHFMEGLAGVPPEPGGSHPAQGTCNALLGLTADTYLELITSEPCDSSVTGLQAYLRQVAEPALMWWAVRCEDLGELQRRLEAAGCSVRTVVPGSRRLPDGSLLTWELLMPEPDASGIAMPFFIRWDDPDLHPARRLASHGELDMVTLQAPEPGRLQAVLGDSVRVRTGAPRIELRLRLTEGNVTMATPKGPVEPISRFF